MEAQFFKLYRDPDTPSRTAYIPFSRFTGTYSGYGIVVKANGDVSISEELNFAGNWNDDEIVDYNILANVTLTKIIQLVFEDLWRYM